VNSLPDMNGGRVKRNLELGALRAFEEFRASPQGKLAQQQSSRQHETEDEGANPGYPTE